MEADHNELQDFHSPREKYQLTDELGHLEIGHLGSDQQNLHFGEGDNPFSYYDEINKRESISSQEEIPEAHSHLTQQIFQEFKHNSHINSEPSNAQYPSLTIGQNINSKPPIILAQSPKGKIETIKKQTSILSPPASIKFLKQAEFDLSAVSSKLNQSPNVQQNLKLQEKYKEEISNDLEELKISLQRKGSKKKSNKQQSSPNINFNKTYAPSTKGTFLDDDVDLELEQMKMLTKIAHEKKNANYQMLKIWDSKRAERMALHGKMIEMLQSEMDMRIKSSLQNFENYQTFFREKARQEQKYVTAPVINTRYALQNNSLSKNVYINCSVILNSLCDENTNRCNKISDFIHLIRINILKELTEAHLNSSQKELLTVRQKISTLKASLKKCNQQTEEKSIELANLFKEQSNSITHRCDKDFYRTQLSFLRKAMHQIELQKQLGQYCLEYYHTAVQQQLKRSNIIRQAMITYSKGLQSTYNFDIELQMEQMGKNEELKLIEEYFSLEDMFDQRTLELFKIKNNIKGDLAIDVFTSYINKFNYEMFDSRIILLKEFNVRYLNQSKTKDKSEVNCYIAITVDNFLHLTFNSGRGITKPDITIKISNKALEVKLVKDDFVDIIKKDEKRHSMMSYFWESKIEKVHRIKFSKKDSKEQFMDYITKLMIGNQ